MTTMTVHVMYKMLNPIEGYRKLASLPRYIPTPSLVWLPQAHLYTCKTLGTRTFELASQEKPTTT